MQRNMVLWVVLLAMACRDVGAGDPASSSESPPFAEVRGTWLTTTANAAIATPDATASTMRRLREIGLNTVYVEAWKDGYTQFPSEVSRRALGVGIHPALNGGQPAAAARDLLGETLIEAHRNGLIFYAWFEYGFMAAHASSQPHLRRMKPDWLSRDIRGSEVAPNGFVWLNPLHPEVRRFLIDLVLEAVDKYDLDGVQFDDRIVWPHAVMGYDDFTRRAYAAEHGGRQPPSDHDDPSWRRWRADKVESFARQFLQEVRARRPGLRISLSPAVYPWSWRHYLLDWPKWATWTPSWDEFVPQAYRIGHAAFEKTWREQVAHLKDRRADRIGDLMAGIRIVGEGRDATWPELRDAILLARETGSGGHVLWFSRGVLDVHPDRLRTFYGGHVASPRFAEGWRVGAVPLRPGSAAGERTGSRHWCFDTSPGVPFRLIGDDGLGWRYLDRARDAAALPADGCLPMSADLRRVEWLVDRRGGSRVSAGRDRRAAVGEFGRSDGGD